MPETVSSIDITELAGILEDRKSNSQRIAVIIGSRAGALFHSEEFYDELKAYSTRNFADMDERSRFYECYSILDDICIEERCDDSGLLDIVSRDQAGPNEIAADVK